MTEQSKPTFVVPTSDRRETRVFMYRLYDILRMAEGGIDGGNIYSPMPWIGIAGANLVDCTDDSLLILADIANSLESLATTTENMITANNGVLRTSFPMIQRQAFDLLNRIKDLRNEFLSLPAVRELGDEAGIVQLETGESDEQANALGAATWVLQDFVDWCRSADGNALLPQGLMTRLCAAATLLKDANNATRNTINPAPSSNRSDDPPVINYADYTPSLSKDPQLSTILGCGKGSVDEHLIRFHQDALVDGKLLSDTPKDQQADAVKGKHDIRLLRRHLTSDQLRSIV